MVLHTIIVIFGLALFETVSSIDNAIVNFHLIIVDNKAILYLQALNI